MEKLIELSRKASDKAEVYQLHYSTNNVSFENAKLHNIDSKFQSGASLRVIKNGKVGFAYTRNLQNREEFLRNALNSLQGGVEANYEFPLTGKIPELNTYAASLEKVSNTTLVNECERVSAILKSRTNGEIIANAVTNISQVRIINTAGTDISYKSTVYFIYASVVFPGSAAGIMRFIFKKAFEPMPDSLIDEIIHLYNSASKAVTPERGPMKTLFMPNSSGTLIPRILSGLNGKSVYEKISPIAGKTGQPIWSDKITVYDDPLNEKYPLARAFDDEGVACQYSPFVENGVLKSFYCDLNYASKLKTKPTGHGYKWTGDPITVRPVPGIAQLCIKPGNKSFAELVKSIDRGIILEGALGGHSGNIPNGDYSVAVCPALYVKNGEIVGQVKDAMVAGNIYQTLKNVVDIGDTVSVAGNNIIPPILCDGVSVVTKR